MSNIIRALVGVAVFLGGARAVRAASNPDAPIDLGAYPGPVRVSCVGDSITEGWTTSQWKKTSWPADLQKMLGPKWKILNFGAGGRTLLKQGDVPYQTKGPMKDALESKPDVVVIMLGTNDAKPQNWGPHGGEFVADYRDMIEQFEKLPTHPRVFICRPPFVTGENFIKISPAVVREEIPLVDRVAREMHVGLIDVYAPTSRVPKLIPDTVHPNDAGQVVIAKVMFKALTGRPAPATRPTSMPAR